MRNKTIEILIHSKISREYRKSMTPDNYIHNQKIMKQI